MINKLLRKLPGNGFNQRWGVGCKMRLRRPDGELYLTRLRVFQTPFLGLYVHWFHLPDPELDLHSHPWSFRTMLVKGWYEEHLAYPIGSELGPIAIHRRTAWRPRKFPENAIHRLAAVGDGSVSVVLVGRRRADWGWFVPGEGLISNKVYASRGKTEH